MRFDDLPAQHQPQAARFAGRERLEQAPGMARDMPLPLSVTATSRRPPCSRALTRMRRAPGAASWSAPTASTAFATRLRSTSSTWLVGLVQQLGEALGCAELRLVANGNRTAGRALGPGQVRADYEQLWQELGAERRPDGDFTLPCVPLAPLDVEQVAQKRRSEARKRHRMVQDVTDAVIDQFTGRGRPALALLAA
jgi:hypothetical protein